MPIDVTTTPALNDATKLNDYIRLRDNDRQAGVPVVAGAPLLVGGSFAEFFRSTSFFRLPQSPAFEIDGALTQYVSVYLEADAMRADGVGSTVSAVFDLWDATAGAVVAGSELTVSIDVAFPNTKHGKTSAFTLNSGVRRYHFRMRSGTLGVDVSGFCKLVAKTS